MSPYRTPETNPLTVEDLVFVGCGVQVAAVHRATGGVVWKQKVSAGSVSAIHYDADVGLLVGSSGSLRCLDPLTGGERWHNRLKGFGHGDVVIATARRASQDGVAIVEEASQHAAAGAPTAIIVDCG